MSRLWTAVPAAAVLLGLICAFAARESLVLAAVLALLLGLGGGALLLRTILRSSASIEEAARSISAGVYSARARRRGPAELVNLTEAFNAMAQQVQLQMALASEGSNRLLAALHSSLDPVVALDRESRVLFANLAAQRLFTRESREIVGNPISWLLPDEQVVEAIRASRERGVQTTVDIVWPGNRLFQLVTSSILGGGEWAVLIVIHDESDRHRTDQIRRDFVANVSHELRTPLAGIKAVIETLAEGAIDDREAATDFLDRADSEVDRLIQLVEELLELSRIESGEIPLTRRDTQVASLLAAVVERLQPQAERKRQHLTLKLAGEVGRASIDPERLESAVVNLVQNAVKFTPEGGSITVSAARDGKELSIEVSDTGIGIDAQALPRIFERFYKEDRSRAGRVGSGIGLAIVKHTVEAHGGSVSATSRLGAGSTFRIALPLQT